MREGDTQTSVECMIEQITKHYLQVEKVAYVLEQSNLKETCKNIHWFLYNHFQYLQDDEEQLLRSPACAWKTRYEGIDCKSYSIIASCLLLNLDIKHYIRKIKQPAFAPENYTHVYVIVPIDQTNGTLKKGYYTIDGTLPTTEEPIFTGFKDYFMSGLKHYALNGAASPALNGWTNSISFDSVKNLLKTPVSCIGGTAFDANKADEVYQIIGNFYTDYINQWNEAVKTLDLEKLGILYPNFWGWLIVGRDAYKYKRSQGYNKCTTESINRMINVIEFFENKVAPLLLGWLKQYFIIEILPQQISFNSQELEVYHNFYFSYTDPAKTFETNVRKFTLKPGVTEIKAFEFTPYIEQIAQTTETVNVQQYLNTLSTILLPNAQNPYDTGNETPVNTSGSNSGSGANTNKGSNTGLKLLAVGLLAFGAYKYFNKKSK